MIEIFFCFLLHSECSILLSKGSNEIKNSTTSFTCLELHGGDNHPFFLVESSNIKVFGCEIITSIPLIRSRSSSFIILSSIALKKSPSSLIESSSDTITLEGSSVTNLVIPHNDGTFLSSGYCRKQRVVGCEFVNISRGGEIKRHKQERWSVSDDGLLENSLFERSEDTFYGFVITGPTVMTLNEFTCLNSSFIECVRNRDPPKRIPLLSHLSDGTCGKTGGSDCEVTSHIANSSIGTFTVTFTDAVFTGCSESSTGGGGLYIGSSSSGNGQLTLTRCSFTSCSTTVTDTLIGGGGVMVDYAKVSVTSTNFTECKSSKYGGAFAWDYGQDGNPTGAPFFKGCVFCTNSAPNAPDFCMNSKSYTANIFDSECISYNEQTNPSGYLTKYENFQSATWITSTAKTCPLPPLPDDLAACLPDDDSISRPLFVSTTGGSTAGDCGLESPCESLQSAYGSIKLKSGTTIILMNDGTHTAAAFNKAGTSSATFSLIKIFVASSRI